MNFIKEELVKAIEEIDINPNLKNGRHSSTYDLVYNEKLYPPILVISVANTLRGGNGITLDEFGNNVEIPFKLLRDNGFEILNKNENKIKTSSMKLQSKELIKYIFETNLDKIEKSKLAQNKGLSALCLLYKTKMTAQELTLKLLL